MPSFTCVAALCGAAVLATACTGSPQGLRATPSPASDQAAPAVTAEPLAVGSATKLADEDTSTFSVAVLKYRPIRSADYHEPRTGHRFVGIEAKFCAIKTVGSPFEIGLSPWRLSFRDDTEVEPYLSLASQWELPLYPERRRVADGRCIRGWLPFEIRRGARPALVTYAAGGSSPVEWKLP